MLMPSSVMLMALLGRPLIVESRAVPDVLKPGSDVSESIALRLVQRQIEDLRCRHRRRDSRSLRLHDEAAVADHGNVLLYRADRQHDFHARWHGGVHSRSSA